MPATVFSGDKESWIKSTLEPLVGQRKRWPYGCIFSSSKDRKTIPGKQRWKEVIQTREEARRNAGAEREGKQKGRG